MTELNDRESELRVKGHLYEIAKVNDRVIGGRQGWPASEGGYKRTLLNVAECADKEAVDEVALNIKDYIESNEERPTNRRVRRHARSLVTEKGFPATSYLNNA